MPTTPVVATSRWMVAHLGFAVGVPVLILAALGLGLRVGSGIVAGDIGGELANMLGLTISLTAAVWVIAVGTVAFSRRDLST